MLRYLLIILGCLGAMNAEAQSFQTSDDAYKKPLKQVLEEVQQQFNVKIKYADTMVAGKWVSYADWRYRKNDIEATLSNILSPFDMKFKKDSKPNTYKLSYYEYYRWEPADGWAELDRISAQYNTLPQWEARKDSLRTELFTALQLSPLPPAPKSKPIVTAIRKYNGYTVENIAIEILPGLYINGSLYKPGKIKGRIPVILNPDGHWYQQRYRKDCQLRCAALAKMGAMAFSYDLFAWGESLLQFREADHRRSLAVSIQALGGIRILDYLLNLPNTDPQRVGITGGSGGGSHTVLMAALDKRIKVSAPVVAISSYFYGGCPCESGMPIHACGNGTDNVEIAAMAAPQPQLLVSDGGDWTDRMPDHDLLYLKKVYGLYGQPNAVENVHLPAEGHDFGISKRKAVYDFMARSLGLNHKAIEDAAGNIDESFVTIEKPEAMYVFGEKGEQLPANAIKGFAALEDLWKQFH